MGSVLCHYSDESPLHYEIVKEGLLNNKASFVDSNPAKWVVLSRNPNAIICFKSNIKNPQDCTAYFCLQDVEFSYDKELKIFSFKRIRGDKQSWSFFAENEDFSAWVEAIEEMMQKSKSSSIRTEWTVVGKGIEN